MRRTILLVILALAACREQEQTVILGIFDPEITDTLLVTDVVRSEERFDEIVVNEGRFRYSITTEHPDIIVVANKDQTIEFNFLTYPGE